MKTFELYGGDVKLSFYEEGHKYQVTVNGVTSTPVGATTILRVLNKPALMLWPMYEAIDWIKKNCRLEILGEPTQIYELNDDKLEQAAKAHVNKSDRGKDVGTQVHAWIERFLRGRRVEEHTHQAVDIDQEIAKIGVAFQNWFLENNPKVLAVEQPVYSQQYDYAGTFDALLEIGGKKVLVDIKTSNVSRTAPLGIYAENFLQLGGYSLAHKEESTPILEVKTSPSISTSSTSASIPSTSPVKIDDLMVINAGKTGKLSTLRASEVGLSVAQCEDGFINCVELHNLMKDLSDKLKEV